MSIMNRIRSIVEIHILQVRTVYEVRFLADGSQIVTVYADPKRHKCCAPQDLPITSPMKERIS